VLSAKSGPPRNISRLLVFKLGANGELPAPPPLNQMKLDPPAFTGTAAQVAQGAGLFQRYCSVCHGDAAVAGALNPDLRRSGLIGDPKAVRAIVIEGKLQHQGMVSFKAALKDADAEAIRQYVIKRANEDKALEGS
jgi:alcohol dehydrogenase (cytochrome c)/quinohemoprotein ethanol dehydrogenase